MVPLSPKTGVTGTVNYPTFMHAARIGLSCVWRCCSYKQQWWNEGHNCQSQSQGLAGQSQMGICDLPKASSHEVSAIVKSKRLWRRSVKLHKLQRKCDQLTRKAAARARRHRHCRWLWQWWSQGNKCQRQGLLKVSSRILEAKDMSSRTPSQAGIHGWRKAFLAPAVLLNLPFSLFCWITDRHVKPNSNCLRSDTAHNYSVRLYDSLHHFYSAPPPPSTTVTVSI